jgi:N-hydroxyarylamine O-acetyltransferase
MSTEVPSLGTDPQGQFTLTPEQLQQYFARIGYEATTPLPPPTTQTLWDLHSLQATTIPFENLSLVHHKLKTEADPPIPLHIDNLFHKLVAKRRGGYCYEVRTPPTPPALFPLTHNRADR